MKKTKEKEHYLKEIYKLEVSDQMVTVSGLSVVFGISKSSVSNMVKKLVAMKLLSSAPTRPLSLLRKGENLPGLLLQSTVWLNCFSRGYGF